jgi:hypothetical protein
MARKKHIVIFLLVASSVFACTRKRTERLSFWEEEDIRRQERFDRSLGKINPTTKLKLSIRTEKNEYFQGEPINVVVSLKNISTDYINIINEDLGPGLGTLISALIDSSGYFLPVNAGCISVSYMIRPDYCGHTIAPGDSIAEILYTHYLGREYRKLSQQYEIGYVNYADPGVYTLRVVYEWPFSNGKRNCIWSESVTSNDIEITIKELPEEEIEALRMFLRGKWHYCDEDYLPRVESTDREVENYKHYSQLLKEFPTSVFAQYAKYYMALFQMNKDTELAIEYFEQLLQDGSSIRTQEIRYGLMKCYQKMGRSEDYECIIDNYRFDKSLYNKGVYRSMRLCM